MANLESDTSAPLPIPRAPHPEQARIGAVLPRVVRAAWLDASLYTEAAAEPALTRQALTIVGIAAVCTGIGVALDEAAGQGLVSAASGGLITGAAAVGLALIAVPISSAAFWTILWGAAYLAGKRLCGGAARPSALLRTLGFAQAPGVLALIPTTAYPSPLLGWGVGLWELLASVLAVRQAFGFGTVRALVTALVGWFVAAVTIYPLGWAVGWMIGFALSLGPAHVIGVIVGTLVALATRYLSGGGRDNSGPPGPRGDSETRRDDG